MIKTIETQEEMDALEERIRNKTFKESPPPEGLGFEVTQVPEFSWHVGMVSNFGVVIKIEGTTCTCWNQGHKELCPMEKMELDLSGPSNIGFLRGMLIEANVNLEKTNVGEEARSLDSIEDIWGEVEKLATLLVHPTTEDDLSDAMELVNSLLKRSRKWKKVSIDGRR